MKAIDIIIKLAKLSDTRQFLAVLLDSKKAKLDKELYGPELEKINRLYTALLELANQLFNGSLSQNPFDIDVQLGLEEHKSLLSDIDTTLTGLKKDKLFGKRLNDFLKLRDIFEEFLASEKRYVDDCQKITAPVADRVIAILRNVYAHDPDSLKTLAHVGSALHDYRKIQNHFDISIGQMLELTTKPFDAIKFLNDKVSLIEQDRPLFEQITFKYDKLNKLLLGAKKSLELSDVTYLQPLERILIMPSQRFLRYDMFFAEVLKNKNNENNDVPSKLAELCIFYEEHDFPNLVNMQLLAKQIQEMTQRYHVNSETIHSKIRQLEDQEKQAWRLHYTEIQKSVRIPAINKAQQKAPRGLLTVFGQNNHQSEADLELLNAAITGDIQKARVALNKNANINSEFFKGEWRGHTPLTLATQQGHTKFVAFLLGLGFDKYPLDLRRQTSKTAAHIAAENGLNEILEMLLLVDPQLGYVHANENGFTPLHSAIMSEKKIGIETIKLILKECGLGVVNIEAKNHKTPFMCLFENKKQADVVMYLIGRLLADPETNASEIEKVKRYLFGKLKMPKRFLGLLYAPMDENNRNFLKAAQNGNVKLMGECLAKKGDIAIRDISEEHPNYTALMHASAGGHLNAVVFLLKYLSNEQIRAQSYLDDGDTALHLAAANGHTLVVEQIMLKDSSTITFKEGRNGFTPLHYAVLNGHIDVVNKLLEGCVTGQLKQRIKDNVTTPFRLACDLKRFEIALLLLEKTIATQDTNLITESISYLFLKMNIEKFSQKDLLSAFKLSTQLQTANAGELILLHDLLALYKAPDLPLTNMFSGKCFSLEDNGINYDKWQSFDTKETPPSELNPPSNYRKIHIRGSLITECVVGCSQTDNNKQTWVHSRELLATLGQILEPDTLVENPNSSCSCQSFWASRENVEKKLQRVVFDYLKAQISGVASAVSLTDELSSSPRLSK